jgi:hypothetical protein
VGALGGPAFRGGPTSISNIISKAKLGKTIDKTISSIESAVELADRICAAGKRLSASNVTLCASGIYKDSLKGTAKSSFTRAVIRIGSTPLRSLKEEECRKMFISHQTNRENVALFIYNRVLEGMQVFIAGVDTDKLVDALISVIHAQKLYLKNESKHLAFSMVKVERPENDGKPQWDRYNIFVYDIPEPLAEPPRLNCREAS